MFFTRKFKDMYKVWSSDYTRTHLCITFTLRLPNFVRLYKLFQAAQSQEHLQEVYPQTKVQVLDTDTYNQSEYNFTVYLIDSRLSHTHAFFSSDSIDTIFHNNFREISVSPKSPKCSFSVLCNSIKLFTKIYQDTEHISPNSWIRSKEYSTNLVVKSLQKQDIHILYESQFAVASYDTSDTYILHIEKDGLIVKEANGIVSKFLCEKHPRFAGHKFLVDAAASEICDCISVRNSLKERLVICADFSKEIEKLSVKKYYFTNVFVASEYLVEYMHSKCLVFIQSSDTSPVSTIRWVWSKDLTCVLYVFETTINTLGVSDEPRDNIWVCSFDKSTAVSSVLYGSMVSETSNKHTLYNVQYKPYFKTDILVDFLWNPDTKQFDPQCPSFRKNVSNFKDIWLGVCKPLQQYSLYRFVNATHKTTRNPYNYVNLKSYFIQTITHNNMHMQLPSLADLCSGHYPIKHTSIKTSSFDINDTIVMDYQGTTKLDILKPNASMYMLMANSHKPYDYITCFHGIQYFARDAQTLQAFSSNIRTALVDNGIFIGTFLPPQDFSGIITNDSSEILYYCKNSTESNQVRIIYPNAYTTDNDQLQYTIKSVNYLMEFFTGFELLESGQVDKEDISLNHACIYVILKKTSPAPTQAQLFECDLSTKTYNVSSLKQLLEFLTFRRINIDASQIPDESNIMFLKDDRSKIINVLSVYGLQETEYTLSSAIDKNNKVTWSLRAN